MSSLAFFQFFRAPRPFSRSQVIRFRMMNCSDAAAKIDGDDSQSPQMYMVDVDFSNGRTRPRISESHRVYSATVVRENRRPLKSLFRLYGGSRNNRSTWARGKNGTQSRKSPQTMPSMGESL